MCLNATSSRAWKYSKEEQALGETLKSLVQSLIDSKPSKYLRILEEISTRIGLGSKLEVI
jgi:predicted sugar kinase